MKLLYFPGLSKRPFIVTTLDEGQLFTTGLNLYGQTGDGRRNPREPHEVAQVARGATFSAIAAADGFMCAIGAGSGELDHRLYCWGRGHRGQNAMGAVDPSQPVRVSEPAQ